MDSGDVLSRPAPPPDHSIRYGPGSDHVADVRLPAPRFGGDGSRLGVTPLVLFLHGGFWRAAYDRTHTGSMAAALAAAGYLVCVPEFRRVGGAGRGFARRRLAGRDSVGGGSAGGGSAAGGWSGHGSAGGGWPGTFDDVATAVDKLPSLVAAVVPGWRGPVLLAGHSAGGHLALWAAGRHLLPEDSPWHANQAPEIGGIVALAAVSDLVACHAQGLGGGAADDLLGGGPEQQSQRYAVTDPSRLIPLGVPLRIVHGCADDRVPCDMSRAYAARARDAGDDPVLTELPGCGHFELIDPLSAAWPAVLDSFEALAPPA